MAEEENNNIAREWGKLIHKSFKCKLMSLLRYWDSGVGYRERGCCGQSQHTASKRNISVMDLDLGIIVWNEMDYHSDIHRNLMSDSQKFDNSSLCSADFTVVQGLLFSD
jgi:hypothetical protein